MKPDEHLIVDGYNTIHAWPDGKRLLAACRESARASLVDDIRVIHDVENIMTTIVFDGQGDQIDIETLAGSETFSCVYSPSGVSADGIIERLVQKSSCPNGITVVSRDNMIAETIRSLGAILMTPDGLSDWIVRCQKRQRHDITDKAKKNSRAWQLETPWDALG